ncbi:MAG TPA: hypothetical protein DEB18_06680, partial [Leeuwenhoekiella sp.]|nr:hypothetical protein [Leeuwenhoekiella sp.]
MILIMENWRKFLNEEEGPKIDQAAMDAAMGSMKGMLSGKGPKLSPKRAKIQQRLEKIGMSKSEAVKFIEFKGMGGDAELEKNVAGLEKYAQTPLNKWPQQGKLSPGDPFELTTNQRSWKGQVGDPKAPAWIQNRIPGWTTKNPIYPATPEELGFDGMRLLNRKLRAAAGKVPQAAAQQKQAPAAAAAQQKQAPAAAQQKQ